MFAVLGVSIGQLLAMLVFVYIGLASSGGTVPLQALPGVLRWLAEIEPLRREPTEGGQPAPRGGRAAGRVADGRVDGRRVHDGAGVMLTEHAHDGRLVQLRGAVGPSQ